MKDLCDLVIGTFCPCRPNFIDWDLAKRFQRGLPRFKSADVIRMFVRRNKRRQLPASRCDLLGYFCRNGIELVELLTL
jgi:hypothetical protein